MDARRNLRIGVNARTFSDDEPSGEVQTGIKMIRKMAEYTTADITLFGHDNIDPLFPSLPVKHDYYRFNSQIYGLAWEQIIPPKLAQRIEADLLFCPSGNGPVRKVDVPTVTWIHDIFGYRGLASRSYQTLQQFRAPRVARNSDAIMTVSEYSKHEIVDEFGIDENDVSIVYNGIDAIFFESDGGEVLELPEQYLLFVGGMYGRKNFSTLQKAVRELRRNDGFDYDLVIIGPRKKFYYEKTGLSLNESHVQHLGFVTQPELKYAYANADVFVFPSLYEGFGLPPLEAMASGTPVVASNRPCMPEILGDAAHFVDPTSASAIADGIATVLSDPEYRNELIVTGKEHAQGYTWERVIDRSLDVFHSLV